MTTVTSYTAERMKAIEDGTVVDGDVVGDDLILVKRDGTQINAGNVRGPQGIQGPVGSDVAILNAVQVYDVGIAGQIRAGRQLTAADFTNMGLSAPLGLWNLSDLTDVSGNGRNLLNKGAVPFDKGINGGAATAARFSGSTAQSLYIADTGSADPFRIKMGSFGAWIRMAKGATAQQIMSKWATGQQAWCLYINASGTLEIDYGFAAANPVGGPTGITNLCDDRWHFAVGTFDGSVFRIYADGILEGQLAAVGTLYSSSGPFNIGSAQADAGTAASTPFFGRIDEAFVTGDVLSEDEIRNLYCAKVPHALGVIPTRATLRVRRQRRGATFIVADFPVQPVRLHNFTVGSLGDEGSNGIALTNNGAAVNVNGADGAAGNAMYFNGTQSLSATDAGLPEALTVRSFGCWIKTGTSGTFGILGWGSSSTTMNTIFLSNGVLSSANGADIITGLFVADGYWHHVVVTEDNAALDGVKRKLYMDGHLIATSITMNPITLGGANRFRIGANPDGSSSFTGQVDGVFVMASALTGDEIYKLYAKGSQALTPSPKNAGDHIEAWNTTDILVVFDSLESTAKVDLGVAG